MFLPQSETPIKLGPEILAAPARRRIRLSEQHPAFEAPGFTAAFIVAMRSEAH